MKKEIGISEYLEIILRWRKTILQNVVVVTLFAIILSLVVTHKYTATTTVLPPSSETESMLGILSGGIMSSLSTISRITGRIPGMVTPSDLYAAILKSGTIKGKIIKRFNLKKEFKAKTMYEASKALDEITRIGVTPEGLITVSVTYKNKYLATDIANAFVEELDRFNTETAMTMGKKYRIFIEKRLNEVTDTLAMCEKSLRDFQEKYKTIALDEEMKNAIETIVRLKSEIIFKEVQRNAFASASSIENPYLNNFDREINELKNQLRKIEFGTTGAKNQEFGAGFSVPFNQLPELSQKYVQLLRDVKIQEAVYELLRQQYEQAKILELKDTPTIQVLDYATPPEKRSFPKRTMIVVFAFFLSLLGSIPIIFFYEYLLDIIHNPHKHKKAVKILSVLLSDYSTLVNLLGKIRIKSKNN